MRYTIAFGNLLKGSHNFSEETSETVKGMQKARRQEVISGRFAL
jgi:hypothetical protein